MNYLSVRLTHSPVNDAKELVPCEVIISYRICIAADILLGCSYDSFANLTNGNHSCAALRIHCCLAHVCKLLNKNYPNRLSARLSAEDIRKLNHGNIQLAVLCK